MTASLVNHLWQSTLVAGLAWLVTLALRRDRAGVRYGVWLAASLKFLAPFSILTTLGERFGVRPVVVASFVPYQVMVDAGAGPIPQTAFRLSPGQPPPVSLAHRIGTLLPDVLLAVWALGAAALLIMWFVRWRRVAAIARQATRLTTGPVHDMLRRLETAAGARRPIAIVESRESLEPGVLGVFRPTLVWPSRIDAHLSAEQVEAIFAHEIMHVRRHDNLAAAAHMAVQAVFWFHPIVWWLGARLVDERERACDEAVLVAGREPQIYAEGILKTCQLLMESPLACVSGVTGSELKKRIEYIMTNQTSAHLNGWKKSLLASAAVATIAVPFVAGIVIPTVRAQQVGIVNPPPAGATAASNAAFDVTSVKPNNSGSGRVAIMPGANGSFRAENVSLGMMIRMSNQLQDNQIVGGPKWLFEDRYDMVGTGTAPGREGTPMQKFKTLLTDRFRLVTHMEKREQPMFALVLARKDGKLGEKIAPSTADCTPQGPNGRGRGPQPPPAPGERPTCGNMIGPGRLLVGGQTMAAFATQLSRLAGGIVVDKTGLTGLYDLELNFSPDPDINGFGRDLPPQPGAPPPAANGDAPSIFGALQEQLGLKLEATKGLVDVLVVDSAEKPAAD